MTEASDEANWNSKQEREEAIADADRQIWAIMCSLLRNPNVVVGIDWLKHSPKPASIAFDVRLADQPDQIYGGCELTDLAERIWENYDTYRLEELPGKFAPFVEKSG